MKRYAQRDTPKQGEYYFRHVMAMTAEGLHDKSAIAAELAHRDIEIDRLKQRLSEAVTACEKVMSAIAGHTDWSPSPHIDTPDWNEDFHIETTITVGDCRALKRVLETNGRLEQFINYEMEEDHQ